MAKKQPYNARQADKALADALSPDDSAPIILHMPKQGKKYLSDMFGQKVHTKNAPMTKVQKIESPRRGVHKNVHDIPTSGWHDFEEKLKLLIDNGKTESLNIAFEGYVQSYNMIRHNQHDYLKGLTESGGGKEGAGHALFVDKDLTVGFPLLSFNEVSHGECHDLTVCFPYAKGEKKEVGFIYAHTPDMEEDNVIPDKSRYIFDGKMAAARDGPEYEDRPSL